HRDRCVHHERAHQRTAQHVDPDRVAVPAHRNRHPHRRVLRLAAQPRQELTRAPIPVSENAHPRTMEFHMKYGKKIALAAVATLTALSLAGCATGKGDEPAAGGGGGASEELSIELVSKGFQHQFWQA